MEQRKLSDRDRREQAIAAYNQNIGGLAVASTTQEQQRILKGAERIELASKSALERLEASDYLGVQMIVTKVGMIRQSALMDREPGWVTWTDERADEKTWSTIHLLADGRFLETEQERWDDSSLTMRFKFVTPKDIAMSREESALLEILEGLNSLARPQETSSIPT